MGFGPTMGACRHLGLAEPQTFDRSDHGVTQSEIQKIILYMDKDKEVTLELAME